jgi:hypothetical protein
MKKKLLEIYINSLVEQVVNEEGKQGQIGSAYLFKEKIMTLVKDNIQKLGNGVNSQHEFLNQIKQAVNETQEYVTRILHDVISQEPQPDGEIYEDLYRAFERIVMEELRTDQLDGPMGQLSTISDSSSKIRSDLDLTFSMIERTLSVVPYQVFFSAMS